jgi:hypothetical protein
VHRRARLSRFRSEVSFSRCLHGPRCSQVGYRRACRSRSAPLMGAWRRVSHQACVGSPPLAGIGVA